MYWQPGDAWRNTESTAQALLGFAPQAMLGVTPDGRVVIANETLAKMFGYGPNELIGRPLELLLPKDVQGRHCEHHKNFFANPAKRTMGMGLNLEGQRKDGKRFPIEVTLSHVETSEGRLGIAFVSDITERKRLEAAFHESESKYHALSEHMREGLAYCKIISENGVAPDFIILAVNQRFEILTGLKDVTGEKSL